MTRTFDLSSRIDHPAPLDVIADLHRRAGELGLRWVLIGAAARDLVVHLPSGHPVVRATNDVDIAIAVEGRQQFLKFTGGFASARGAEHKVLVRGVEVDIVPFGGIESGDTVTFADGHELDVVGLREAAAAPDTVILPHGLRIPVASIEAQSALKTLAWRDRHFDTSKDATDLLELLKAGSQGPYGDELWSDEEALAINEFDASLAGAWRIGRGAGRLFDLKRGNHVLDVLNDPRQHQLLRRDMRSILAAGLLTAYQAGFRAGSSATPTPSETDNH